MKYCPSARLCVAATLLFAVPVIAAPQMNKPEGDTITEITLQRTPHGNGAQFRDDELFPADKVVLRADGTAIYVGRRDVNHIGRFNGKLEQAQFARLATLLKALRFFGINRNYGGRHGYFHTVSAVRDGKRKTVTSDGRGYIIELWGIERAILGVAADIKWQKIESAGEAN